MRTTGSGLPQMSSRTVPPVILNCQAGRSMSAAMTRSHTPAPSILSTSSTGLRVHRVGRMRPSRDSGTLSSFGDLGIGTTSPNARLDVHSSPTGGAGNDAQIRATSSHPTATSYCGLAVAAKQPGPVVYLTMGDANWPTTYFAHPGQAVLSTDGGAGIAINTNGVDNNGLVIDIDGNVSIGAETPVSNAKLLVAGRIRADAMGTDSPIIDAEHHSGGFALVRLYERSSGAGAVVIRDNTATDQVSIEAAGPSYFNGGNVGIGTATPAATLDVNGTARLAKYQQEPFPCDVDHDGTIALTHLTKMCVCNGSAWRFVKDDMLCVW